MSGLTADGFPVSSSSPVEAENRCAPNRSFARAGAVCTERRKEVRYATCEAAEVFSRNLANCHELGVVRDVSRNGLRLEMILPVSVGARLKICLRKRVTVFAVARYCRQTGDTYQVGAEIESVYPAKGDSTSSLSGLDDSNSPSEARELVRSLIEHHISSVIGNPDRLQPRLPPAADGPI